MIRLHHHSNLIHQLQVTRGSALHFKLEQRNGINVKNSIWPREAARLATTRLPPNKRETRRIQEKFSPFLEMA